MLNVSLWNQTQVINVGFGESSVAENSYWPELMINYGFDLYNMSGNNVTRSIENANSDAMGIPLGTLSSILFRARYVESKLSQRGIDVGKYDNNLKKRIYTQVDEIASFPGGFDRIFQFLIKNMDWVKQEEFQEMIKLDFVIDVDGKIINAKIGDTKLEDYTLWDKEALKVLKIMPLWKFATCKKKKVPFQWSMPLRIHPNSHSFNFHK